MEVAPGNERTLYMKLKSLPGDLFLLKRGQCVGVFEPHAEACDDLVPWFKTRVDPGPGHYAHLVGLSPCHDALVVLNTSQVGTAVVVLSLNRNKILISRLFVCIFTSRLAAGSYFYSRLNFSTFQFTWQLLIPGNTSYLVSKEIKK